MAKKKFHFNPETLSYEETDHTLLHKVRRLLIHLFSGVSLGIGFFFIFVSFIASPEEKQLARERNRLQAQYKLLERSMDEMYDVLRDLQQRDDNLYRVIFRPTPFRIHFAIRVPAIPNTTSSCSQ